ncbi:MAG TPA: hypothetical protein VG937_21980 [Polyangiaceae bacterium]|nr:hypothetical protein [Polyangiaceae bacterium]
MRRLRAALLALSWTVLPAIASCSRPTTPPTARAPERFGPVSAPRETSPLLALSAPNTNVLAIDAGVAGDRISGLLEIPSDQCAILIARAGASVEDVDLLAYGEDGSVVGTDEGPDKTPALLVCPPHPARVWVAARIAAGHGLVAVGAQRVAPGDAARTAAMYGVRVEGDTQGTNPSTWPGLDEQLEAHRTEIGGGWQDVRRVAVPLDARLPTRVSAQVDAGRCLDAFVSPSDEVGHLELTVLDANGAILGRAASSGRERFVVVCSPLEATLALELRPQSGRGIGVLALSRTRAGTEPDIDGEVTRIEAFPEQSVEAELSALDTVLAARSGYAKGKKLASTSLEVGRRTSVPLTLPAGCSRLDVVGGRPLRGVEAWVWSAAGQLLAHARGGARGTLFVCGAAGPVRMDLEASLRPGPVAILLHAEGEVPPALLNAPLAAGRLLNQVVERGVLRRASEIGQVHELTLSDSEFKSLELTVPFGRCVDVALALGKEGVGAEIRLVAATTSAEIAVGRGAHATSARVCALDASSAETNLKTRAEFRVHSGAGKALVATRMLSPTR